MAALAGIIVAVVGIAFIVVQLKQATKQLQLDGFAHLMTEIGSEKARTDRNVIHTKVDNIQLVKDWEDDVKEAADRTVVLLDRAGFLILHDFINKEQAIKWLGEMICSMWTKLEPYVKSCRQQPGRSNHVPYFELLAKECKDFGTHKNS